MGHDSHDGARNQLNNQLSHPFFTRTYEFTNNRGRGFNLHNKK